MSSAIPTFTLTIGNLTSTSDRPVGGPNRLVVERDMDIAADGLRIELSTRAGVALGDAVTLDLGYGGQEQPVFAGTVQRLRPAAEGAQIWALGGLQPLLELHAGSAYERQTAGAIVRDLLGRASVPAGTVEDGPKLPRFVVDVQSSAYVHVRELAQRLGFELYADVDGKAMFHAVAVAAGGASQLRAGLDVLALEASSVPLAWVSASVGGESPMSGDGDDTVAELTVKDAQFRGTSGSGDRVLRVADPAARTKDLADRFATGYLASANRGTHTVRLTVAGRVDLDLGDPITVAGHADALAGGDGYVRALRHRVGVAEGFLTDIGIEL